MQIVHGDIPQLPDPPQFQSYKVLRDDLPDVVFEGKLIAKIGSSPDPVNADYSRSEGRWTELSLYTTRSGNFVCHVALRSQLHGERTKNKCHVIERNKDVELVGGSGPLAPKLKRRSEEEMAHDVVQFFGYGWLAKRLYEKAAIRSEVRVD